jgi:hypothetical protein
MLQWWYKGVPPRPEGCPWLRPPAPWRSTQSTSTISTGTRQRIDSISHSTQAWIPPPSREAPLALSWKVSRQCGAAWWTSGLRAANSGPPVRVAALLQGPDHLG